MVDVRIRFKFGIPFNILAGMTFSFVGLFIICWYGIAPPQLFTDINASFVQYLNWNINLPQPQSNYYSFLYAALGAMVMAIPPILYARGVVRKEA